MGNCSSKGADAAAQSPAPPPPPFVPLPSAPFPLIPHEGLQVILVRNPKTKAMERLSLGAGSSGSVYKGLLNGSSVAIKECNLQAWAKGKGVKAEQVLGIFQEEGRLQASTSHPNVLPSIAHAVDAVVHEDGRQRPLRMFIVLPLMGGGNLRGLQAQGASLALRLKLLVDMAEGLAHLHARGIVHSNLKPENVLLTTPYSTAQAPHAANSEPPNVLLSPLSAVLSDYGLSGRGAKLLATHGPTTRGGATPGVEEEKKRLFQFSASHLYSDPQALQGTSAAAPAGDIFSLAVLAWQLLARKEPYAGMRFASANQSESTGLAAYLLASEGNRPSAGDLPSLGSDPSLNARLAALLGSMWSSSPEARPAAPAVLAELRALLDAVRLPALEVPWKEVEPLLPASEDSEDCLGRGGFGAVYRCVWRGQECALKVLRSAEVLQGGGVGATPAALEAVLAEALKEVHTQSGLVHPNVLPLYAYAVHKPADGRFTLAILLPRMKCSLQKTAGGEGGGGADLALYGNTLSRMRYVLQIAEGLAFVHSRDMLHGDLKSSNILLTYGDSVACISDFGAAMTFKDGQGTRVGRNGKADTADRQFFGTPHYLDPQVLTFKHANRKSSDVYSLGILTWELLSGQDVYPGLTVQQITTEVSVNGKRPDLEVLPGDMGDKGAIKALLKRCWNKDQPELASGALPADARPSAADFLAAIRATYDNMLANPQGFAAFAETSSARAKTRVATRIATPGLLGGGGSGSGSGGVQPLAASLPPAPKGMLVSSVSALPRHTPLPQPGQAAPAQRPPAHRAAVQMLAPAPKGAWSCTVCEFLNDASAQYTCSMCNCPRAAGPGGQPITGWDCKVCTLHNEEGLGACYLCHTPKGSNQLPVVRVQVTPPPPGHYVCGGCTVFVKESEAKCPLCEAVRQ